MADLTYPESLKADTGLLPANIEFTICERQKITSSSIKSTINLYMPEQLSIPNTTKWDSDLSGPIAALAGAMQTMRGPEIQRAGGAIAGAATQNVLTKIASMAGITPDTAPQGPAALSVATGMVKNPYLTAVFGGVDFRNFRFNFKFSPISLKDCQVIDDIIKEFRAGALPGYSAVPGHLAYPSEFMIRYKFEGQDHPWLKKFKRAVCTSVDVKYGQGSQWTQYRNGFPTLITLDLSFKEIQIVTAEEVMNEKY